MGYVFLLPVMLMMLLVMVSTGKTRPSRNERPAGSCDEPDVCSHCGKSKKRKKSGCVCISDRHDFDNLDTTPPVKSKRK